MKKKILAMIMAFTLVVSLTACGGKADNKSSKTNISSTLDTVEEESTKDTTDTEETNSSKTDERKDDKTSSSDKSNQKDTSSKNEKKASTSTSSSNKNTSNNSSSTKPSTGSGNNITSSSSKPSTGDSSSSSSNSSTSKPHQHSYITVVSSTKGDCSHKAKITKKCSCGDTITVDGNYGSHNWEDSYKEVHHEAETKPVYAYCYVCNECGAKFNDEQTCGEHCIFDCGGGYSYKEWVDHYETVKPAWTEKVPNGKKCTICGQHSN